VTTVSGASSRRGDDFTLRILVLVLAARVAPYPAFVEKIRQTWASAAEDRVEVLVYYGGDRYAAADADVALPVPDDLAHVGEKTIACFEHVLDSRAFDIVFRTNCSSYVDLPNLRAFVDARRPRERFYAGVLGEHEETAFASGSGYFLTRDLVELVVAHADEWDHSQLDDVALGKLLRSHGIAPVSAPRQDVRGLPDLERLDTSHFHFRCKTDSRGRRGDMELMCGIDNVFRSARGLPLIREPLGRRVERGVRRMATATRSRAQSIVRD
jgi:hypothetical protein